MANIGANRGSPRGPLRLLETHGIVHRHRDLVRNQSAKPDFIRRICVPLDAGNYQAAQPAMGCGQRKRASGLKAGLAQNGDRSRKAGLAVYRPKHNRLLLTVCESGQSLLTDNSSGAVRPAAARRTNVPADTVHGLIDLSNGVERNHLRELLGQNMEHPGSSARIEFAIRIKDSYRRASASSG